MIKVDVKKASLELEKAMLFLSSKDIKKATSRAINHTLSKTRTAVSKEIRSVYNMAASDVRDDTVIQKSTASNNVGMIKANSRPLSLSKFNPISTAFGKGKILVDTRRVGGRKGSFGSAAVTKLGWKTGVSIEVAKGNREVIPSAFLLHQASGNASVMARGNYGGSKFDFEASRLPISKLSSKSIYWASQNSSVIDRISVTTMADYSGRLLHELTEGLRYAGGR